mgnify:CR=1 FL=1
MGRTEGRKMTTKTSNRGRPGRPRGQYPNNWCSGPDLVDHDKFIKWHKHRSQARFRQEPHEITFAEWLDIWRDPLDWFNRGTAVDAVCLVMLDYDLGWHKDNVEIVTRAEQLYRQGLKRVGCKRGSYKKRTAK